METPYTRGSKNLPALLQLIYEDQGKMTTIQKEQWELKNQKTIFQINGIISDIDDNRLRLHIYYYDAISGQIDTGQYVNFKYDKSYNEQMIGFTKGEYISCKGNQIKLSGIDLQLIEIKNNPYPKNESGGCFIATACYGDYDAPEVLELRKYRDEILIKNKFGKTLVLAYYAISPFIARRIMKSHFLKTFIRKFILSFILTIIKSVNLKIP